MTSFSIKDCVIIPNIDYKGKNDVGATIDFVFNHTGNIDSNDIKFIIDYSIFNENGNDKDEELYVSEIFKNISVIYKNETVALNTHIPYLFTLKHKITEKHEFDFTDFFPGYHFNIMNDYVNDNKLVIRLTRSFIWAKCNSIKIKYKCDEAKTVKNDLPHFDSQLDILAQDMSRLNIRNLPLQNNKFMYLMNQMDDYKTEQIDLIKNNIKYKYYHNDILMKNDVYVLDFDYGFNMYRFKIPSEVKEKYKNIQLVCYYSYYI